MCFIVLQVKDFILNKCFSPCTPASYNNFRPISLSLLFFLFFKMATSKRRKFLRSDSKLFVCNRFYDQAAENGDSVITVAKATQRASESEMGV